MNSPFHPASSALPPEERQAISRLRQLLNQPGILQASLFHRRRPCGKDYCRCAASKRHHHASWYVALYRKGHIESKTIPESWVEPLRGWIHRSREAQSLLDKLSGMYWRRLKQHRR